MIDLKAVRATGHLAARCERRAMEFAAEQATPRADLARIDVRLAELTGGAS